MMSLHIRLLFTWKFKWISVLANENSFWKNTYSREIVWSRYRFVYNIYRGYNLLETRATLYCPMSWARISKDNRSRDSELWSDGRLPIIAENLLNLAWQIYDHLAYEINIKKKERKKENWQLSILYVRQNCELILIQNARQLRYYF